MNEDQAVRVGYDRFPNERFKNGDVDGLIMIVRPGVDFEVKPDGGGERVKFPWDTENDYDRCPGCGRVDPKTHRWYFAMALLVTEAESELAIADVLRDLETKMAAHMQRYEVKGSWMTGGPKVKGNMAIFNGVVIPSVLCDKAPSQ